MAAGLFSNHVVSVLISVITLAFAASILQQSRPVGTTFAWLLVVCLVPYVGIPLYLAFGGRKFQRLARSKPRLPAARERVNGPFEIGGLGVTTSVESVEWISDGVAAYQAFVDEIQNARVSIRITTFLIGDDETGRTLVEALAKRAAEGLAVHLLVDDILWSQVPKAHIARLRTSGGHVHRFMPLLHMPFRGRSNLRNHRKIAVFDGERAIVGGMNLADDYMGPSPSSDRFLDLSVRLRGPAVEPLDEIFRADWQFAAHVALGPARTVVPATSGTTPVYVVPSGPDAPSDPLYDTLLTGIFRAERRFWVATPYFVPDQPLVKALSLAAHRGIDVRVVVPSVSNHRLADLVAAPILRELAADGVVVERLPRMLHAKAFLVDDRLAAIGSANFDMRSLFLDYEITLLFTAEPDVARLSAWFENTVRGASTVLPASGWARSQIENVARLLAPLV